MLLHPFFTLAAIVLTANHYWIDAFAALVLFAIALTFDHFWERIATAGSPAGHGATPLESTARGAQPQGWPGGRGTGAPGSRTTPACRD